MAAGARVYGGVKRRGNQTEKPPRFEPWESRSQKRPCRSGSQLIKRLDGKYTGTSPCRYRGFLFRSAAGAPSSVNLPVFGRNGEVRDIPKLGRELALDGGRVSLHSFVFNSAVATYVTRQSRSNLPQPASRCVLLFVTLLVSRPGGRIRGRRDPVGDVVGLAQGGL